MNTSKHTLPCTVITKNTESRLGVQIYRNERTRNCIPLFSSLQLSYLLEYLTKKEIASLELSSRHLVSGNFTWGSLYLLPHNIHYVLHNSTLRFLTHPSLPKLPLKPSPPLLPPPLLLSPSPQSSHCLSLPSLTSFLSNLLSYFKRCAPTLDRSTSPPRNSNAHTAKKWQCLRGLMVPDDIEHRHLSCQDF